MYRLDFALHIACSAGIDEFAFPFFCSHEMTSIELGLWCGSLRQGLTTRNAKRGYHR
jgi:hypothetical protein